MRRTFTEIALHYPHAVIKSAEKITIQDPSRRKVDALANDERLKVRVSLQRRATTISEVLRLLNKQTGVKLISDGVELGMTDVAVSYHDTSLGDVLDSLSRIHNCEWKRRKDGALILQEGFDAGRFDIFRPRTEAEAEIWRQGAKFLNQFNKLPSDTQNTMNSPSNGTEFGKLPSEAQNIVRAMLQADLQDQAEQGKTSTLNPDQMQNLLIHMQPVNRQEGFRGYALGVQDKGKDDFDSNGKLLGHTFGESHTLPFMVFDDPRDNVPRVVPKDQIGGMRWRGDKEDALARQENGTNTSGLNKLVTLARHRYSLYEALSEMATQAQFNFAIPLTDAKDSVRPFFACSNLPLRDALDALCKTHSTIAGRLERRCTWGPCKSGTLLLHTTPLLVPGLDAPDAPVIVPDINPADVR